MPNQEALKIAVFGGQLVTLAGPARPRTGPEMQNLGVVVDGAFLCVNGKISLIGNREQIERRIDASTVIVECQGRVVLPGFVDAHTHFVFAGNRLNDFEARIHGKSYREIAISGGGIKSTVEATRSASEYGLLNASIQHAQWMLSNGTTTAECKSGYGLSLEPELKILRTIQAVSESCPLKTVPTFLGAHAVPAEAIDSDRFVQSIIEEMLPAVAEQALAEYCDAFCEEGYFSVAQCRHILAKAKSLGMGLRIHADQFASGGGAELAAELEAATADHLEHIEREGINALGKAGVQPVLLPGSVYALGLRQYPPMREMIDHGLAPVLATDFNPGSSPTPSIPMILSLACTQMGILPSEAITAATINAAYSLGRGNRVGSIEVGKAADFIVFDCDDCREIPYYFGNQAVSSVYVDGVRVQSPARKPS